MRTRKYDIAEGLSFAVNDKGIPYRCTEHQLVEAQLKAHQKMANKGKPFGDLNPKYAHKEGRKYIFDVKLIFTDIMEPDKPYTEEVLKPEIYRKTNVVKEKIHDEILQRAVNEKVLLSCINTFGKKEYVLPSNTSSTNAVQQDLPF